MLNRSAVNSYAPAGTHSRLFDAEYFAVGDDGDDCSIQEGHVIAATEAGPILFFLNDLARLICIVQVLHQRIDVAEFFILTIGNFIMRLGGGDI